MGEDMGPVVCGCCGARLSVGALTEDEHNALRDQHTYQKFLEELHMLLKVQFYYRRHPDAEGRIKPHLSRVMESDDPAVVERRSAGVPFDQIELPTEQLPIFWVQTEADREVVDYLRHHQFSLSARLQFVHESMDRLRNCAKVRCPECEEGRLHVPPENWDEFDELTATDVTTWYWAHCFSIEEDGTLRIKSSGYRAASHWSGYTTIGPEEPDYDFWRWLVTQKEFQRRVETSELRAIQDKWSRRSTGRP